MNKKFIYNRKNEVTDAPKLTEEQITDIREAFELYDTDGSGLVKPKDLIATF
jgi:Ca2+-binding EF-hand superfamily protein